MAQGQPPTPTAAAPEYFIQIDKDGQFVNGCNYFKVAGWNQWEAVEAAAGAPFLYGASIPVGLTGPELVRSLFEQGAKVGFNVMRTWAFAVDAQYALETSPGVYNEAVFKGMDYMLELARQNNIKVILALTSYWTPTGGVPQYLKWANATDDVEFYTNPAIIKMYQDFVSTVLNRKNTLNGRVYKDDPVIMAWDLLNEPRCVKCPNGTVANWFAQQADFVKSIDTNHLITTGEEGFYGCCNNPANPGVKYSEWAAEEGQNFILDHSSPNISFATMHLWPDNWQDTSPGFSGTWINAHTKDAGSVLKKPIILEEWGKWINLSANATVQDRNTYMASVYDQIKSIMSQPGSPLQGSLFWQWYLQGQQAGPSEGGGGGLFGIYETDAAFKSIQDNVAFIQSLNGPVSGCSPPPPVPVPPVPSCQATWVNNTPGTGMDGPNCTQPINECVQGTDNCAENAACINTNAGFKCQCYYGYTGDGTTCTKDPAVLSSLSSLYWSQPRGLSCKAGLPVDWPPYSPGWVYDPTNSFAYNQATDGGKLGSRANVTLEECMIACQMADTCESFVYNDVLMQCFLDRGQCPEYNYCQGEPAKCVSTNDRGGKFSFNCGYWVSYYRLDSNATANCLGFVPSKASVGKPDPAALAAWSQWRAANPTAPIRETPPMMGPAAEPATAGAGAGAAGAAPSTQSVSLVNQAAGRR